MRTSLDLILARSRRPMLVCDCYDGGMMRTAVRAALFLTSSLALFADFSYQQSIRITGGQITKSASPALKPVVADVVIKGRRMVTTMGLMVDIIDADKATLAEVNLDAKTFSMATFDQMKQSISEWNRNTGAARQDDIRFDASVDETGKSKTIGGITAKEMVLKLVMRGAVDQSMDITADMWLAPVEGYDEVLAFQKAVAEKLGFVPGQNPGLLAGHPELWKGMTDLYAAMAKLDGMPVEMILRIGGSGEPARQMRPASSTQSSRSGSGRFGRGRPAGDQQSPDNPSSSSQPFLEMTVEISGASKAAVDDAKFQVPAGFTQEEPVLVSPRTKSGKSGR